MTDNWHQLRTRSQEREFARNMRNAGRDTFLLGGGPKAPPEFEGRARLYWLAGWLAARDRGRELHDA
jgi:hypothetical protein